MKIKSIHIYKHVFVTPGRLSADAEIEVPGLGIVKIEHALTDETISRIEAEAITALRLKLGQSISENKIPGLVSVESKRESDSGEL